MKDADLFIVREEKTTTYCFDAARIFDITEVRCQYEVLKVTNVARTADDCMKPWSWREEATQFGWFFWLFFGGGLVWLRWRVAGGKQTGPT